MYLDYTSSTALVASVIIGRFRAVTSIHAAATLNAVDASIGVGLRNSDCCQSRLKAQAELTPADGTMPKATHRRQGDNGCVVVVPWSSQL